MNFVKRAILSITKRKIKTIVLIAILCVIANMVLAGLAIRSATIKAGELARKKLGASVTVEVDAQKLIANAGKNENVLNKLSVSLEDIEKLKDLKHVKAYNYVSTGLATADNFKQYKGPADKNKDKNGGMVTSGGVGAQPEIMLEGTMFSDYSTDFIEQKCSLVEGRKLTSDDYGKKVALIEKTLADQNKLKIGDKLKVKGLDGKKTVELEIVGIYKVEKYESNPMIEAMTFLNPYNKIYVPNSVTGELMVAKDSDKKTIEKAVYYLDDPANIDAFKNDVKDSGLDLETYKIDAKDSLYKQMMGPIENVGALSKNIVILVAIAGAAILSLIIILSLKDRRYEIGVLMSMGESRFKIISQLLVEILLVACIAFSLSTFTGKAVAQKIGDNLLQNEIRVSEKQSGPQPQDHGAIIIGPGGTMNEKVDSIDKIDVSVSLADLQRLFSIGFMIVVLATTVPTILILRFNPKTILSKNE